MDFALDTIDTKARSIRGAEMTVLGLNGLPLLNSKKEEHAIMLQGPDSPTYRRLLHANTQKRILAAAEAAERGEKIVPDPLEAEADAIEVMAQCTLGWRGFLSPDGEPIEFSTDAARELYSRFPVIREQVDAFMTRRVNFLPVSPSA